MGDVYQLAYRVIACLGPEDAYSKLALSTLAYLGTQVEYDEVGYTSFWSPDAEQRKWNMSSFELPYQPTTWTAIGMLLGRPWFSRLWIAQEILRANKAPGAQIQAGFDTIASPHFQRAIICLYWKSTLQESLQGISLAIRDTFDLIRPKKNVIFGSLMVQMQIKQCKDSRDKLYGILGLAPQRFAMKIKPDYRDTALASKVYQSAFLLHAEHVQRLELFSHCFPERHLSSMPSWVPEFSAPQPMLRILRSQFVAGASHAHLTYRAESPTVLTVCGIRYGIVNRVTEPLPRSTSRNNAINHVRQWQPLELDTAIYQPTGQTLRRAYAVTLLCGLVDDLRPNFGYPSAVDWERQNWTDALFSYCESSPDQKKSDPNLTNEVMKYVERALAYCSHRMFFEAAQGCFGLAPTETRIGT